MKTTKIIIKNILGIKEAELDGSSVELSGANGTGKTSVLDAIRYALTNANGRDYIVRNGENEGEVLIETDTGLSISRKKRNDRSDYKLIKDNEREVKSPETFIQSLFTPLQLNPVEFVSLPKNEQNRILLNLIVFDWDLNWIQAQFGEIPRGVDYQQNILQVLNDIQSDNGVYFQTRQDINRDVRNKRAFIAEIAADIPEGYKADTWEHYDLSGKYEQLTKAQENNNRIERAKSFADSYNNKVRGFEAEAKIAKSAVERANAARREDLTAAIERMKAEIAAAEKDIASLDEKAADKFSVIDAEFDKKVAQLQKDMAVAEEYIHKDVIDTSALSDEINTANAMIKHLNEYKRMKSMQEDVSLLEAESTALTDKIELARTLPGEILKTATIPVAGLTVENGIPLIHGLPVSNLSEGEKLDLCVDIAISKPNALRMILLDGTEKLSDENRDRLYRKCIEKGLQFIATRTTNDNELVVTKLC